MNRPDDERTAISILVCFACLSLAAMCVAVRACEARASAQDSPAHGGPAVDEAALLVAQVCFLEATWRRTDCAAIVGVARVRAARQGIEWTAALRSHSALDGPSPRSRLVRSYTLDQGSQPSARWLEHVAFAGNVAAGRVPTPCPGASLWGSPYLQADIMRIQRCMSRGTCAIARCSEPTANMFLREVSR